MCGIAGVVDWGDRETVARMADIQRHRGPDDEGLWFHHFPDGSWVGLGSRRLAIIDLTPAGHMPMCNEDGTIWITYNGEIYNFPELRRELLAKGHTFLSNSDTEVIIHLYEEEGQACVKRLNGMFAFAICDLCAPDGPVLFLARDHFGIKPLYYAHRGHRFAFASEVKALLQLPDLHPEVDWNALHQYLTFLWVPDPKTMFRGIYKLSAGHYATFRGSSLDVVQYWDLDSPSTEADYLFDEAELIDEIRERFRHSVRAQMVSDVPVGAFLSAGVDSSSIVAMMAETVDVPVRTYTITFPKRYRVGEITLDDPDVVRRVGRHLNCDHQEIVVEPEVSQLLPRLIWHMDEPVADPAIIMSYLVCREARQGATVLLSGVGGDEIFAGYRKYFAHYWAKAYHLIPDSLRRQLIEPAILGLPSLRGTRFKGLVRLAKKMARSGSLASQDAFLMNGTYLDDVQKALLYTPELKAELKGIDAWRQHRAYFSRVAHADFLTQMLYLDLKTFMVSLNLTYNDKMSMASSVEVRVPFLDWELVEFVVQHVPPNLKMKGFLRPTTKYIFRKAMKGILPDEVLTQPKAGFGAPVDYWLSQDLREMVDDLLSESSLIQRGLFRPEAVHKFIQEHRSGRQDWSFQIWQLLTLEIWMGTFLDGQ
ncbi:asparagine synthase (glutamine-hydrolyzing) [Acidobacteria bacterium AH-259-A15]|nr:asparagine synthase (glutamine-hydrolyzing) [Acidobacteria bacterium AH-259-A15]